MLDAREVVALPTRLAACIQIQSWKFERSQWTTYITKSRIGITVIIVLCGCGSVSDIPTSSGLREKKTQSYVGFNVSNIMLGWLRNRRLDFWCTGRGTLFCRWRRWLFT